MVSGNAGPGGPCPSCVPTWQAMLRPSWQLNRNNEGGMVKTALVEDELQFNKLVPALPANGFRQCRAPGGPALPAYRRGRQCWDRELAATESSRLIIVEKLVVTVFEGVHAGSMVQSIGKLVPLPHNSSCKGMSARVCSTVNFIQSIGPCRQTCSPYCCVLFEIEELAWVDCSLVMHILVNFNHTTYDIY